MSNVTARDALMRVGRPQIEENADRVRWSCSVQADDMPDTLWFQVRGDARPALSQTADAALLALLLPGAGFAGDVTMSAIKRDLGVKDAAPRAAQVDPGVERDGQVVAQACERRGGGRRAGGQRVEHVGGRSVGARERVRSLTSYPGPGRTAQSAARREQA